MIECVINISEGRSSDTLGTYEAAGGHSLRDVHSDEWHHRSVFTLVDQPHELIGNLRNLIRCVLDHGDLRDHDGVHPRYGLIDVVPFVALDPALVPVAVALRDETAQWLAHECGVGVFVYGDDLPGAPTLPQLRARLRGKESPDFGPLSPDPRWGFSAVGQRPVMLAWNIWLRGVSMADTQGIVASLRSTSVRSMAFAVGEFTQVSCNLIDPAACGPSQVFQQVRELLPPGGSMLRSELVGLTPQFVLDNTDPAEWAALDLTTSTTIESRLSTSDRAAEL